MASNQFKNLLTKSTVTATFTSDVLDVNHADRFLVQGTWASTIPAAAVVASGEINTNDTADSLKETGHGLETGIPLVYTAGTAAIEGVADGSTVFAIRVDDNNYQLASSQANALAGTEIDLGDVGIGNQTFTPTIAAPVIVASGSIDSEANTFTSVAHGFVEDQPVTIATSGTLPAPLVAATTYYINRISADVFKLTASPAGAAIDITTSGVGNQTVAELLPTTPAFVIVAGDVDTEANTITSPVHNLNLNVPVRITTTGTVPAPLALATTYYVIRTSGNVIQLAAAPDGAAIDLTTQGIGTHTLTVFPAAPLSIAPGDIDTEQNSFRAEVHTLETGVKVALTTSDTEPTGLAAGDYYIVKVDDDNLQLAATIDGAAIDITSVGVGTQTLTPTAIAAPVVASGSIAASEFTSALHELISGMPVRVSTSNEIPSPLVIGTTYWAIKTGANTFKLAASQADSLAGTPVPITLTTSGVGNQTVTPVSSVAKDFVSGGVDSEANQFTSVAHGLVNGMPVRLANATTQMAGLLPTTTVYVSNKAANTFKLSSTAALATGGTSDIDITSIGVGAISVTTQTTAILPTFTSGDVNTESNLIAKTAHGILTGQPIKITGTDVPAGITAGTTYFVRAASADTISLHPTQANAIANANIIDITDNGSGTITGTVQGTASVVLASGGVDTEQNSIVSAAHGLVTGQAVALTTDGTEPTGLAAGAYFVIRVDANSFKVATLLANARLGTPDAITGVGAGNHTFTAQAIATSVVPSGSVSGDADTFYKASHGFTTGTKVALTTSNTAPGGTAPGDYFIIATSANLFKLAASLANAIAGTAVDLTDQGIGNQTLTPAAVSTSLQLEACASNPDDVGVTPVWFPIASAEAISGSGTKLWEFVDKAYDSVRISGTHTAGSVSYVINGRADRLHGQNH